MPSTKTVAVAGAGHVGSAVVTALLAKGTHVRVLVRPGSEAKYDALKAKGAQIRVVPTNEDLEAAVTGCYAVVSTVAGGKETFVDYQIALFKACKAAGVKRFFGSDFGVNVFNVEYAVSPTLAGKAFLRKQFLELRGDSPIEIVTVINGIFANPYNMEFCQWVDWPTMTVNMWGKGHTPIDMVTFQDLGRIVAEAAIDDAPLDGIVGVSADRVTVEQVLKTYEEVTGKKFTWVHKGDVKALEAETATRLKNEPANVAAWLPLQIQKVVEGGGVDAPKPWLNERYPAVKLKTVKESIAAGEWATHHTGSALKA